MEKQPERIADENVLVSLLDRLERGQLTNEQQRRLDELLRHAPLSVVITATHRQSYSGPIPPPDQLQKYPDDVRRVILKMAQDEQAHAHAMDEKSLSGAITKDRRGQMIGGLIAIAGLGAAAWIAPYSAVAAAIIGALDLFGMVALFVAPRILECRQSDRTDD